MRWTRVIMRCQIRRRAMSTRCRPLEIVPPILFFFFPRTWHDICRRRRTSRYYCCRKIKANDTLRATFFNPITTLYSDRKTWDSFFFSFLCVYMHIISEFLRAIYRNRYASHFNVKPGYSVVCFEPLFRNILACSRVTRCPPAENA